MSLYHVFDVEEHSTRKNILLEEIGDAFGYECETTDFKGDYTSKISKTNYTWDNRRPAGRIKWPYCLQRNDYNSFVKFLETNYKERGRSWRVFQDWYNQYNPNSGSDHPFHNHSKSNGNLVNGIACIYYVELYDESLVTVLKDPETGEEVIPKVKEGQILTFDANIDHKSPRNFSDTRKTVIAFNIEFK